MIFSKKLNDIILEAVEHDELFRLVNKTRVDHGLKPLKINDKLVRAASIHAKNMCNKNKMAHDLPGTDTPTLKDRLSKAGLAGRRVGENLASGYNTAEQVVKGWLGSPAHKNIMLNKDVTHTGISICANGKTTFICQLYMNDDSGTSKTNTNSGNDREGRTHNTLVQDIINYFR